MKISIGHFCVLSNFLDVGFISNEISNDLTPKIYEIMHKNSLSLPEDWMLIFQAGYNNARVPLVAKNKLGSYPSDKMKYIKIVIPVPLLSEIEWGVKPEQHLYPKEHYDKLMKNFWELDINFRNFNNRSDYITACLKKGIKKAFEEGFTVGGMKVKAKKPVEIFLA